MTFSPALLFLAKLQNECSQTHRGNRSKALSLLRQAVDHGLPPFMAIGMKKDPDLKSLQGDPRFGALVAHAKERAATAQTSK
jgi:hypothetical protein